MDCIEDLDISFDTDSSSSGEENNTIEDLIEGIKSIQNNALRTKLQGKVDKLKTKIKDKHTAQVNKFKSKIAKIKQRNESKAYLVKKDEVTFSFIMISFVFTFGLLFYWRTWIFINYVILKTFILIFLRWKRYLKRGWQYYLLDYCYTVSCLMFVCTKLAPRWSYYLLSAYFINSMGPLLISFLVFRFRIVWHDVEAYTSFFMHISPALISWIMRFHVRDSAQAGNLPSIDEWDAWLGGLNAWGTFKLFLFALVYYLCWNIGYYLLVLKLLGDYISNHDLDTLFKYFRETSSMYKYIKSGNEKTDEIRYMMAHGAFSLVGLSFASLMIFQRYFTFAVMVVVICIPIWYASTYYHEYFSTRYTGNMEKKISANKKKRLETESMKNQNKSKSKSSGDRVEGLKERISKSKITK